MAVLKLASRQIAYAVPWLLGGTVLVIVAEAIDIASPLLLGLAVGVVIGNLRIVPRRVLAGTDLLATRVLRLGVVMLGFRFTFARALEIGAPGLALVTIVVAGAFGFTYWAGRRFGLGRPLSTLIAAGFAICGASAVAAVGTTIDADDEEISYAMLVVTACGSLALVVLPLLRSLVALNAPAFGAWAGAIVHDVGQVLAVASTGGPKALHAAAVVKLTRVLFLVPLIALLGMRSRRSEHRAEKPTSRPPVVPLFVLGFIAAIALRSLGAIPANWLDPLAHAEQVLFAAALLAIGASLNVAALTRLGRKPLVLGVGVWALIAVAGYGLTRLLGL